MTLSDEVTTVGARRALSERDGPTLIEIRSWPAAVSVPRACSAIGISTSWGYQLIAQGEFPARTLTIGRRSRVLTASLVTLLEGGDVQ
ncbi:MAG: DNA-binding protein [Actinomycetota bacterium]|nr:DNA-binding protein [Actinomycetota bacterium]